MSVWVLFKAFDPDASGLFFEEREQSRSTGVWVAYAFLQCNYLLLSAEFMATVYSQPKLIHFHLSLVTCVGYFWFCVQVSQ